MIGLTLLTRCSEVFGTSEDQSAFDHSEDAENGKIVVLFCDTATDGG